MLAIEQSQVIYLTGRELVSCALKSGELRWRTATRIAGCRTLVAAEGVVLLMNAATLESHDARTGKLLWEKKKNSRNGEDLFVIDGVAWPGVSSARLDGKDGGVVAVGYDIRTGKEVRHIAVPNLRSPEHHHRCYRNKATRRYIITAMEGAEFVDLRDNGHGQNNWVRGACREGIMPCYGLLYAPADQCFCEPGAKLLGYAAVAPAADKPTPPLADALRLEKGPAWTDGATGTPGETANASTAADPTDWPTFRHDRQRHGSTAAVVSPEVAPAWRVRLGGRLSAPVAAGEMVFVASIDAHAVYALDARTGALRWRYVAGGRVDSCRGFCWP